MCIRDRLSTAREGATPRYLVVDTETIRYLHDTLDETQLSAIDTPLLALSLIHI